MPPTTSGLEMETEWEYSGRIGRDGKARKIDEASKGKKGKVKDTKRRSRKWRSEGIRGRGDCP